MQRRTRVHNDSVLFWHVVEAYESLLDVLQKVKTWNTLMGTHDITLPVSKKYILNHFWPLICDVSIIGNKLETIYCSSNLIQISLQVLFFSRKG